LVHKYLRNSKDKNSQSSIGGIILESLTNDILLTKYGTNLENGRAINNKVNGVSMPSKTFYNLSKRSNRGD
jgi:hypothetical protein